MVGGQHRPWPEGLAPWLRGVAVGIARTRPAGEGREAVREVAALNAAALAAARRSVYIETQYLAATGRLDPAGPLDLEHLGRLLERAVTR